MKKKLAVYVDGFNLYHGIKDLNKPHLKWLNLRSLVEKFTDSEKESLEKIFYFSSIATHLEIGVITRHKAYIEALNSVGIEFIAGNFKKKKFEYKNKHLHLSWNKHEEKETDVNIAIHIVRDAINQSFDKMILISNDTDIVPALQMAKSENKKLEIKILTPPKSFTHDSLRKAASGHSSHILEEHIKLSLFPEKIKKTNGKIIHIPSEYICEN